MRLVRFLFTSREQESALSVLINDLLKSLLGLPSISSDSQTDVPPVGMIILPFHLLCDSSFSWKNTVS